MPKALNLHLIPEINATALESELRSALIIPTLGGGGENYAWQLRQPLWERLDLSDYNKAQILAGSRTYPESTAQILSSQLFSS